MLFCKGEAELVICCALGEFKDLALPLELFFYFSPDTGHEVKI
jgi:hypothetical protein